MRLDGLSLTFVALLLPIPKGSSKDRQERSSSGEGKGKNRGFLAGGMMAPEYTGPRIGQLCLIMIQLMYVVHDWTVDYCT